MRDASFSRKVLAPTLPSILLPRTALVGQLQEAIAPNQHIHRTTARYRLVLCCAPAGYGKTTLLAEFARATPLPCCWYFLDQSDTDPIVFLRTLLASVRQVFPQFGTALDPMFHMLLSDDPSATLQLSHAALDALCSALVSELSEPVAFILSNYEEINASETLTDLVNLLLKKLPPQVTLIIESRVIPYLSFTSFIIQDVMGGLDRDALRFSAQEITKLAQLQGLPPLTEVEAEHLATSFDGWIAGILLGTRVGDARLRHLTQKFTPHKHHASLQGQLQAEHHRHLLFTYVVDAVLKQQDTATLSFLQTIAILQQIEPTICNTLCECSDAAERLAYLERQGLFLTSYKSAAGTTYTCHPVIRDVLSEQLRQQDPARFLRLHSQAIELWSVCHNTEQALYHAFTIEAYDRGIALILTSAESFLQEGQRETVLRWLHALPVSLRDNHPQLLLLQASMTLEHGEHTLGLSLLDKAQSLILDSAEGETGVLQAKIAILRSKALCQIGAYAQAEALCQQALLLLPDQEHSSRAAAHMRLGICANLQGQFTLGVTHLQQALHLCTSQPVLQLTLEIHQALANTYYLLGNFLLAEHHLTQALEFCEHLHNRVGKVSALILQGLMRQNQGLLAEAEDIFLQALELSHTSPSFQRGEAYALVNLASLTIAQGHYGQALTYAEQGVVLARIFGNRGLVNDALMSRALSYLFLGDAASALIAVEHMETPGEQVVGYERIWHDQTLALILFYQQQYAEATRYLSTNEAALQTIGLKREHFQVKLRLAACRIAQQQTEEAIRLLEEVASLLAAHQTYTHLVQIELQWLPILLPLVQNHRALIPLSTLLFGPSESFQPQNEQDTSPIHLIETSPNAPTLTIHAFGEPTVLLDGEPIKRWRLTSVKELFFFLLNAPHPVSKETILTALWPEEDERTSHLFHNTIYYLRALLGEACVPLGPAGYSLDLATHYGTHVWYDVQLFQQHRMTAEQALAQNEGIRAKEALLSMVQLYRGDYANAIYNDWCRFRRDELRASYLEAHRQLAQMAEQAEAWNESAEHWSQMLKVDPCLEEAHYGRMHSYVRQGKRSAALRQYQTCQKILQEELGIAPGPAIQNLYRRLTAKQRVD